MWTKTVSFDEALLMTGFGKFNIGILVLSGTILIGMIFETLGLSYISPAAQCDLELTLTQKGWLGAIPFVGIIVTSHLWGWLADTKGRRPVIMYSTAIGSFFSMLSSFSPDLITFAIIRFMTAIFIAGPSAVAYAYLGEFNNPIHRDKMVTIGASFISIGCVLLPALAWLIQVSDFRLPIEFLGIDYRPWRLLVAVLAMPNAICSLIMLKAPESPKFLACMGKNEEAMKVLNSMYAVNGGTDNPFQNIQLEVKQTQGEKSVLRSMWDQTYPLFQRPLLFYTCIACFAQVGYFSCANGFYLWIPEILNRVLNEQQNSASLGTVCEIISVRTTANNTSLMDVYNSSIPVIIAQCSDTVHTGTFLRTIIIGGILSPFMILAGFVVNLLGKRNILIGVPMLSGLSAYAIHWCTNQNVSLLLLGLFQLVGCCIGMMNAVVVEIFPTHLRAMAVCLSLMVGRLGSIMGSNLIGLLIEVNCPSSFFLFGSILIVSSGVCWLIPKPKKQEVK